MAEVYPAGMYSREADEQIKKKKQINLYSWGNLDRINQEKAVNQPAFDNPILTVDHNGKVVVDRLKEVLGW